jgi:TonB family protein
METASVRRLGALNIGHSPVIAPAPQLSLDEQRNFVRSGKDSAGPAGMPQVVPPPPSLASARSANIGGRVVALNLHPSASAPPAAPPGNRNGNFAATPEGHHGASGTPGVSSGHDHEEAGDSAKRERGPGNDNRSGATGDLPSGLYVGGMDKSKSSAVEGNVIARNSLPTSTVSPNLMANARPLRGSVPARPLVPESDSKLSEAEREVFGTRKLYSLTLNMPNLNSASGSWVIHFAELKQNTTAGELSPPVAIRKVDPAFPLELMHQNISGTVTLYAVIRADGKVGAVRVLNGLDDRLDRYACQALARWQFQPATRNGETVDVEAVFRIPFRPARLKPSF